MSKKSHAEEARSQKPGVVNLAEARARARTRGRQTKESLERELEEIRILLDQGLSTEAETRIALLINAARNHPSQLAMARCALSASLEMRGRYRESLEAVAMYESPESREKLDKDQQVYLRVQIGLAYNYTGDQPKAIALLNTTLRSIIEDGTDRQFGSVYAALARVYRSINEFAIARDYAQKALEHYRRKGEWRGMAESYFGIALADTQVGDYEAGLSNFEQALKLIGENPASYLLGKIYTNMAGACWFLKRAREGVHYLEKAINYYERTDHKANATDGYNNLGINLILLGDWNRAQNALERALALAYELDEGGAEVPMILDSIGELELLKGNLDQAQEHLNTAVELATKHGNRWYAGQAMRTLGHCHLAMHNIDRALSDAERALELAEKIGDRQAVCDSRLLLAEAFLRSGALEEANKQLDSIKEVAGDSIADLAISGSAQRLRGLLALQQKDLTLAVHHFGRSVSIFETLGDRYRTALARADLGEALIQGQPARAAENLGSAVMTFRELGAKLDLERAEKALSLVDHVSRETRSEASTLTQLLTLRLTEAVASRELLLRELAAIIYQETTAKDVLIAQLGAENDFEIVVSHGCTPEEASRYFEIASRELSRNADETDDSTDVAVIGLKAENARNAVLIIAPKSAAVLPGSMSLQPLLKIVEMGLDLCALRERGSLGRDSDSQAAQVDQSLLPGFIHSSPAMTKLVEEVHKIRSSDVTVLVTGESGTGKELVSRAIHALSSRRSKVFAPFNCTAVPKELTEGYLFGYKRGAFTGAVTDSPGVIRTAAGGTLFLDEVGDLPIDVQPKLLRFLQDGEIQPLGEQRPLKVDVRIIAATNTELEQLVEKGQFREDLYYRLNVIRLRVPPLRERRSEIPMIVNYYINHYSAKFGRRDIQILPQAIDLLMVNDWPGNVRQLCNEIQRIIARAEDGTVVTPDHLSPELKRTAAPLSDPSITSISHYSPAVGENMTLGDALAELERRMIAEALRRHNGNISRAARELGLTRRGLYLKLERHDLSASA